MLPRLREAEEPKRSASAEFPSVSACAAVREEEAAAASSSLGRLPSTSKVASRTFSRGRDPISETLVVLEELVEPHRAMSDGEVVGSANSYSGNLGSDLKSRYPAEVNWHGLFGCRPLRRSTNKGSVDSGVRHRNLEVECGALVGRLQLT